MNSSIASEENKTTALEISRMLQGGASREEAIKKMRQAGFNKIESIKMLRNLTGSSLAEAKRLVHMSLTWQDCRASDDSFHEQLVDAASKI
jgi:ribosomal protein L7/L12